MQIKPAFEPVCVCFACDDNYAPHLGVTIYSMLKHSDAERCYDIIVLHNQIQEENKTYLKEVAALFSNACVRLIDMSHIDDMVNDRVATYITSATNYRLFLLGDMFSKYHKMLYLDCDMVVVGDIAPLYDMDLEGHAIGAVEMMEGRYYTRFKKAIFFEHTPYNFEAYKKQILKMDNPEFYFNAGMILFDLDCCRKIADEKDALRVLKERKYHYNDQDVLNILFNKSVKPLDLIWNYTVNIPMYHEIKDENIQKLYENSFRENYVVVHYIGGKKPWMGEISMQEHYHKNARELSALLHR